MRTTLSRSLALPLLTLVAACAPVDDGDPTAVDPVICSNCVDDGSGASGDGTTTQSYVFRNLLADPNFDNVTNTEGWRGNAYPVTSPVFTGTYAMRFYNIGGIVLWQQVQFPANARRAYVRFFSREESSGLGAGDPRPYFIVDARAADDPDGQWLRIAVVRPTASAWKDSGIIEFSPYGQFYGHPVYFRIRACGGGRESSCEGRLDRASFVDAVTFAAEVPTGASP